MRINPLIAPGIFITILVGTLVVAQLSGGWIVSGRTTVDAENMAIADIKGWMTLQQVIDGFRISKEELYPLIGVPDNIPTTTALKDIEPLVTGFEITAVRDALTARAAGTGQNSISTPVSQPIGQSTAQPTMQPATAQVTTQPLITATVRATLTPLAEGTVLPASQIKGKMTLREISDQCAVTFDSLLNGLNLPLTTDPNTSVKTLVDQGLITEVAQVQTLVATLQK